MFQFIRCVRFRIEISQVKCLYSDEGRCLEMKNNSTNISRRPKTINKSNMSRSLKEEKKEIEHI